MLTQFYLFVAGGVSAVFSLLAFFKPELLGIGSLTTLQTGFILTQRALTSLVLLHLAFDVFNSNLYRVGVWALIIDAVFNALGLHRGWFPWTSIFAVSFFVSVQGIILLTLRYRKYVIEKDAPQTTHSHKHDAAAHHHHHAGAASADVAIVAPKKTPRSSSKPKTPRSTSKTRSPGVSRRVISKAIAEDEAPAPRVVSPRSSGVSPRRYEKLVCEHCGQTCVGIQGLAAHRRLKHGVL